MKNPTKELIEKFEFDPAHKNGGCKYSSLAVCSAEEQRIKLFIQKLLTTAEQQGYERGLQCVKEIIELKLEAMGCIGPYDEVHRCSAMHCNHCGSCEDLSELLEELSHLNK